MKSLIVYYSYSGNTKKTAGYIKKILSQKGEVDIVRLEPFDESNSFFAQARRAFAGKRAVIKDAPYDVSGYGLICIGTPVWAFAPAPAVNTYIDGIKNINGKAAVCFITYGSGLGANKCIDKMKNALREKGALKLFSFGIQQKKVNDGNIIKEAIEKIIKKGV